jgi:REP element-mobilizing transposase RayT
MTRRPNTVAFWRGRLPHWEVEAGRYFVTIHLAGAIPDVAQARIREIAAELARIPNEADERLQIQRRIFGEMERWLDRADSNQHLTQPAVASMVREAITHREQSDWAMLEYVLMPNHIHLFFELKRAGLKRVLEDFKRWTGHQAAKTTRLEDGRFWQDEWFDHWSRSDSEDERIAEYIRQNPVQAKLVDRYQDWPFGSWSGEEPPK